jgi:hypothetical protein
VTFRILTLTVRSVSAELGIGAPSFPLKNGQDGANPLG